MNSYGARPLVSGTIESDPAPAIAENDPISVENLLAAKRQLEWRRTAFSLQSQIVTQEELLEAERRFHVIKSLHFDRHGEHVPRWAQNNQNQFARFQVQFTGFQDQFTGFQDQFTGFQDQFTDFQDEFRESRRATDQRHQRALNRGLKTNKQCLEPLIRLSDGGVAPNFPETLDVLLNSDEETVEEWLRFYGLDHDRTLLAKKTRLQTFFGILE